MKIIEMLTKSQDAKLEKYYEKWLSIGMRAMPTSDKMRKAAESAVNRAYADEGLAKPKHIIWTRSPIEAVQKCIELGDKKDNLTYAGGYGSHDANWLGFYEFFLKELKIKECEELVPLMDLAQVCGWWWPYENACILSELPLECHVNADGALHNPKGPSIRYGDGFAMYHLNGVEVSKEIAEAKPEQITKEMILGENNSDIRREIIRKVGIAKAIEAMGAETIDTFHTETGGKYELLMIDYDKRGKRPYLKIQCSSSKEVFILGTKPGITKAKDAWEYLNNGHKFEETEIVWES